MNISAQDVYKLRERTGAGVMDCKNALIEAEGDFEKAIEILRKKGQKIAAKRADRSANEGYVVAGTTSDRQFGAILMLNCETDFVSRNEEFIKAALTILSISIEKKPKNIEEVLSLSYKDSTISDLINDLLGKIGEKIELSQYACIEAPFVGFYNHHNNRVGVIVGFNKTTNDIEEISENVAMQIASMRPIAVDIPDVPENIKNKELEIAREATRNEGKPENMIENIALGKLNKFLKENTLLNQEYIMDSSLTVGKYLSQKDPELKVTGFVRLALGE
ncbi:MAG: translation elongation factor Ts [Bacteroidales bacterium]|nr:translation elongation factor Ts [Bacteroidales bacterium]